MKKNLPMLGYIAIAAAVIMYLIGSNSNNLTELATFSWIPLVLAVVCFVLVKMKK